MPATLRDKKVVTCKETFNLHYLESDDQDDNLADNMNERTYKKVGVFQVTLTQSIYGLHGCIDL